MTDFLINTPSHKRWWLPDGTHWYNSILFGDMFQNSVIHSTKLSITDYLTVEIDSANEWKKTLEKHQAEMRHKYRAYRIFDVTAKLGGSLTVMVHARDIYRDGERAAVGHAAWVKLFSNERDKFGNETRRESGTARMLKKLCDEKGSKWAHDTFNANIEYKEQ